MDERKMVLPAWLPWGTTACLAALVACLGELWIVEKTRARFLREQSLLTEALLKGAENQLEAERIVNRREITGLRKSSRPQAEIERAWLAPPEGRPAAGPPPPVGVVAWERAGGRGWLVLGGLPAPNPDRDYQLWLDGAGPGSPCACGVFRAPARDGDAVEISVAGPVAPGSRFILIDGTKGGARTLAEAEARGSIVLASAPYDGNISSR